MNTQSDLVFFERVEEKKDYKEPEEDRIERRKRIEKKLIDYANSLDW